MQDPRPRIDTALDAIVAALIGAAPSLSPLNPSSIALVALSAYGTAAASVRSLEGTAKKIVLGGEVKTIEIGLRPAFFQEGDLVGRVVTLVHEMLHLDPESPGALRASYRHVERSQQAVDQEAEEVAKDVIGEIDPVVLAPLAHDGEVLMRAWMRRPVPATKEMRFDDKDVFRTPIRMRTPPEARSSWW